VDYRSGVVRRLRRAHYALGPGRVRRGVDLLCRHVRHVLDVVDGRRRAAFPDRGAQQADGQVGPGPLKPDRIEVTVAQSSRGRLERLLPLLPGRDWVVLVEPADVREFLPKPVERSIALEIRGDELGPGPGGVRKDRPVDEPLVDYLDPLLKVRKLVPSCPPRIHAAQYLRRHPRTEDQPPVMHLADT